MLQFLERFEAAVFDLDGTLADSLGMWDTLNEAWCARRGLPDARAFSREVGPLPLEGVVAVARRMYGLADSAQALLAEWEAMSREAYAASVRPKPGAVELVQSLKARGWKLSVATASFRSGCEAFLRAQGLLECFDALCFTEELGRDKSHPDVYLACAEAMGVDPGRCVVFEDLCGNAAGVRAAGMGLVLVHSPEMADPFRLLEDTADLAVHSLEELL